MWTYLAIWLVQDGQVPELGSSSELTAGLVAMCSAVEVVEGPATSGVSQLEGDVPNRRRSHWYEVVGLAERSRDITVNHGSGVERVGTEFLLTVGSLQIIARTTGLNSPSVDGSMIKVQCWFEVLADYEFAAFDLPDVARSWSVTAVQIERSLIEQISVTDSARLVSSTRPVRWSTSRTWTG